jgi:hypothetical protein
VSNENTISAHVQKTLYFANGPLIRRFLAWCRERGVAPGQAMQALIGAFMDDLEFQRHQMEITLPVREVRF